MLAVDSQRPEAMEWAVIAKSPRDFVAERWVDMFAKPLSELRLLEAIEIWTLIYKGQQQGYPFCFLPVGGSRKASISMKNTPSKGSAQKQKTPLPLDLMFNGDAHSDASRATTPTSPVRRAREGLFAGMQLSLTSVLEQHEEMYTFGDDSTSFPLDTIPPATTRYDETVDDAFPSTSLLLSDSLAAQWPLGNDGDTSYLFTGQGVEEAIAANDDGHDSSSAHNTFAPTNGHGHDSSSAPNMLAPAANISTYWNGHDYSSAPNVSAIITTNGGEMMTGSNIPTTDTPVNLTMNRSGGGAMPCDFAHTANMNHPASANHGSAVAYTRLTPSDMSLPYRYPQMTNPQSNGHACWPPQPLLAQGAMDNGFGATQSWSYNSTSVNGQGTAIPLDVSGASMPSTGPAVTDANAQPLITNMAGSSEAMQPPGHPSHVAQGMPVQPQASSITSTSINVNAPPGPSGVVAGQAASGKRKYRDKGGQATRQSARIKTQHSALANPAGVMNPPPDDERGGGLEQEAERPAKRPRKKKVEGPGQTMEAAALAGVDGGALSAMDAGTQGPQGGGRGRGRGRGRGKSGSAGKGRGGRGRGNSTPK